MTDRPPVESESTSYHFLGRRVLLVTDVPFWKAQNGSHGRIANLLAACRNVGLACRVWYVGSASPTERHQAIRATAGLELEFSETWRDRLGRRLLQTLRPPQGESSEQLSHRSDQAGQFPNEAPESLPDPIKNFLPEPIKRRFSGVVRRYQPDLVILEYLSLASLLEYLPGSAHSPASENSPRTDRCSLPLTLLDAHDVLSARHAAAVHQGERSWLAIDQATELAWCKKFDLIAAIQSEDAAFFQAAKPAQTLVVGHAIDAQPIPALPTAGAIRFGYLAGAGAPNARGLKWLLHEIWPNVSQHLPQASLTLAGTLDSSVVAELCDDFTSQRIRAIGRVEKLSDFYQAIDVALNPVDLISGLKIKSVESLAYGRPLITRRAGAVGLQPFSPPAITIAEEPADFVRAMIEFGNDVSRCSAGASAAAEGRCWLSSQTIYGDLFRTLAKSWTA